MVSLLIPPAILPFSEVLPKKKEKTENPAKAGFVGDQEIRSGKEAKRKPERERDPAKAKPMDYSAVRKTMRLHAEAGT